MNTVSDVRWKFSSFCPTRKKLGDISNSQSPRIEVPRSRGNVICDFKDRL